MAEVEKIYNGWYHKFGRGKAYRYNELSPQAKERAVRMFNRACYYPEDYEPDYSEIMAETVRFTETGLVWSC